jgi:hypothetical protein
MELNAQTLIQQGRNDIAAKLIPVYMLLLDDTSAPTVVDPSIDVGKSFTQSVQTSIPNATFSLIGAPLGMTINAKTGEITWTPTPDQVGKVSFDVNISGQIQPMILHVNTGTFDGNKTVFFSPDALVGSLKNHPDGNYTNPMRNSKWICKNRPVMAGYHFYFRGGTYYNQGFETNSSKADPDFRCSGTKAHPIVISPWGNERVKLKFDSNAGFKIDANYVTLDNIEIEGVAQDINYTAAVAHWWNNTTYYNGSGLLLNGKGLTIRNNIIHDVPGAGIGVRSGGIIDNLRIEKNIIFNTSWWNIAGTTAIGLVNFNKPNGVVDVNGTAHVVVKDNLVFACESRIFSRVYSKGFSHLSLDEGSSMLIKNDKNSTYDLGFLIEGNFFLHNGKGISIRWDKTTFRHNTLYNNGTTIEGKGAGFRSNGGKGIVIEKNAAAVTLNTMGLLNVMNIIDFSPSAQIVKCDNNFFEGGMSLSVNQKCMNTTNSITGAIFNDPNILDFNTFSTVGASQTIFAQLRAKVEALGYKISPANYKLNINGVIYPVKSRTYYNHQQADIIKWVKKLKSYVSISGPGNFTLNKKNIYGYEIIFSDTSVTGHKKFYLETPQ